MHLSFWDTVLLIVIPLQATLLAYVYRPHAKAFLSIMPLPYTLSSMALGRPVDGTNAAGSLLFLLYPHTVRLLTYRLRVPVAASIAIAAAGYCAAGYGLTKVIPDSPVSFPVIGAVSLTLAVVFSVLLHGPPEPGHRSPLPVPVKWAVITAVVYVLIILKGYLLGFMTLFPMVGVVAAYELRHSLWAYCRSVHIFTIAIIPMQTTVAALQGDIGTGPALMAAWVVFLLIVVPLSAAERRRIKRLAETNDAA